MIRIQSNIQIPESDLRERFVRASGPGGQHVNKTATAVQLRLDVKNCGSLPDTVRDRLLKIASARINSDGELVIEAKRYRSQERNRADARQRLQRWIERATQTPRKRKPTRPGKAAKERRLQGKKQRGQKKTLRQKPQNLD